MRCGARQASLRHAPSEPPLIPLTCPKSSKAWLTKMPAVEQVDVFCVGARGGNPAPVVLNADQLTADEMREIAAECGHEAGFVLAPSDKGKADLRYRFF